MATYEYEKVWSDYASGRMDVEMTMGHALQHIGQLYAAQTTANADRQALRKQIHTLEGDVKTLQTAVERLQKTQTDRLQTLENGLVALQQTVTDWKADIDSLTALRQG
jgi:prefoldin subunit 5